MKFVEKTTAALSLTLAMTGAHSSSSQAAEKQMPRLYVYESDANGFNTKNYFYDNGQEVVAFDSQFTPELAQKSIDFLRTKTQNPITYLVVTHPNPDKFNGMSVFQSLGAKVVASKKTADSMPEVHAYKKYFFVNMAKMFKEETYPKLSKVDITFDQKETLKLKNGDQIELQELSKPGVSSNQTVAYLPKLHSLIVGDLVHHNAHAWLEGGIVKGKATPTLGGWISDLNEIKSEYSSDPKTIVYGGRGESAALNEAVSAQIDYLKKADALVTQYVKRLGANKSELSGGQAGTHFQAIQKEFEKAFPKYSLSYMIGYGVYGLATSK